MRMMISIQIPVWPYTINLVLIDIQQRWTRYITSHQKNIKDNPQLPPITENTQMVYSNESAAHEWGI